MMKLILACSLLLVTACSSKIDYTPLSHLKSFSQAEHLIKKFLREQPSKFVPANIEVTRKYLEITRNIVRRSLLHGSVTYPKKTYIYYSNIGDIDLHARINDYYIWVRDKNNGKIIARFYSSSKSKSEEFINALYSLKAMFVKQK